MDNALKVAKSVLHYNGGPTQWAWAIHRVAGLGVLLFLALHIIDIFVAALGPGAFDHLLFLYRGPFARVLEILLAFGLLYHGINGMRIIAADFFPSLARLRTAQRLFFFELVLFTILFIPVSYYLVWELPQAPFYHNPAIAAVVTLAILSLPVVLILGGRLRILSAVVSSDVSNGNSDEAFQRLLDIKQSRPQTQSLLETRIWFFMRVSGTLLIVLATIHVIVLDFMIGVQNITYNVIVERWNSPVYPWLGFFWRLYDLALLAFASTHGMLGANYVVRDYVHGRRAQRIIQWGMLAVWFTLILMGMGIIFFFRGTLS